MRFKYETLSSLFKKTDAFNERGLALFNNLKETVWVRLEENSTKDEILFMKRYDQLIEEIQILIRTHEAENQRKKPSSSKPSQGPPIILGGQKVDEKEFEDENLCQICCFQQ